MSEHVLISQENNILTLTMNRPEKKNAITSAMYATLAEQLENANTNPDIRVVVITGAGDNFTSGNDINDFLQNPPTNENSTVSKFLRAIASLEKPLIASVNGVAIGVGTTLLLHCDFAYASETAVFQMPFVDLALVPEAGSSYLLPQMMGHRKAAELILLSKKFAAQEAQELGLINQVTSDLKTTTQETANTLVQKAPEALRLSKMLLKKGNAQTVKETMQTEGALFMKRLQSPEAMEVMQAFMQKRQPDFSKFA